MTFPLESVQLLLDIVRGTIPFDLVPAIKAALAIASYVQSIVFPTETNGVRSLTLAISPTSDLNLEMALAGAIKNAERYTATGTYAETERQAGLNIAILHFIVAESLKWIATKVAE